MTFRDIVSYEDMEAARGLFNDCAAAGEILYKPFEDAQAFEAFFLHRREEGLTVVNLVSEDAGAFASGCYAENADKGYITFVGVRPDRRRQGMGREILGALEQRLADVSEDRAKKFEIIFFNPMNFSWVIPGTGNHEHPNAPGVDVSGGCYLFLKNCGYRDFAYQNSYHISLEEYRIPADIQKQIQALGEKGLEVVLYDRDVHSGLEELMDNLNNELWRKEILGNAALPDGGRPLLIVNQGGRAMGFTGPLSVQENGRGYFSGVAVHSDCRGNGAGKVLFSKLCSTLKEMGAHYMTLFTGETNPARNIYEAAGFHIVRTWADMRKERKQTAGK